MKRILIFLFFCALSMNLAGCARAHKVIKLPEQTNTEVVLPPSLPVYSGPKAYITVADFEIKTAKATREIGASLRELLIAALLNTNQFSILERQDLKAPAQPDNQPVPADIQQNNDAQKEKSKSADLIITAAVTDFQPDISGGSSGVGGGGGVENGRLGGLLGISLNKAHMGLDIRIVDAKTSEVLASTLIQGQATDVSGEIMKDDSEYWSLKSGLAGYGNSPMEKAIRLCINEIVHYITQKIPASFYK